MAARKHAIPTTSDTCDNKTKPVVVAQWIAPMAAPLSRFSIAV
jgi:hypothetical protein